ncbi:hypothetical protein MALU111345_20150 [Marinicrinis lubricantis]
MLLFNGAFVNGKNASISYHDRGYYFGDGVYEVFRVYKGRLFEPDAHFRRLERSAKTFICLYLIPFHSSKEWYGSSSN